ncbi:hypothetical protein Cyrtocomes_01041 [Candidatus Cyrtobacter comes]|uniref:Uncharacterized protein n=1 Tax=Candidatus Cyrtobacter comes TaxID=675776 RepID=A0ABU5L9R4_9RICK|nr:hypothetical protein [Candidatus Cyrtobacter comes]
MLKTTHEEFKALCTVVKIEEFSRAKTTSIQSMGRFWS